MNIENNYDLLFPEDSNENKDNVIKSYLLEGEIESMSYMPNTNTINIIIGSNNSGKSRFMRYLMGCKNLIGVKNIKVLRESIQTYNSEVNRFNEENIFGPKRIYDHSGHRTYNSRGVDLTKERFDFLLENGLLELKISDTPSLINLNKNFQDNLERLKALKSKGLSDHYHENFVGIDEETVKDFQYSVCYYIPTLRSAHALFQKKAGDFTKIENDIYLDTLIRYYGFDINHINVFTGLHLYKEILNSRNSKRSVRQSFEKFEKFIGENFFGNKQVDIVAEFNKDESLSGKNYSEIISVHIDGEKETRNLFELGDGIQAIIILMYKIFMAKDGSLIFIDEPELNLHPGMQRLFLEQISSNEYLKSKNLTYFISTHSNHFLDLTLEKKNVSIYSFVGSSSETEDKKFKVRNVNSGDNTVLKNLGVNNSSVFLANCSIWVEGISDRNYIKAFLRAYIESLGDKAKLLREDIDYAFFEYAGSNIDHYLFEENSQDSSEQLVKDINSMALNNKIFLLADSDNAKKSTKKGKRLEELESLKRESFYPYVIWSIREIENLLPIEIWKENLIAICNKHLVKEHQKDIQAKIETALNGIDISKFKKDYIGVFLDMISTKLGIIDGKKILNESSYNKIGDSFGTLVNKREMSEFLLEKKINWEIFKKEKEIEKLTVSIYNFIVSSKA